MTLIQLRLYWKSPDGEVDLGAGYHEVLPPAGSLVTHGTVHGGVWRVLFPYFHLIQEGSMAHVQGRDGRRTDMPTVYLFVEPAQGPHE
jgi:hypothetical protein